MPTSITLSVNKKGFTLVELLVVVTIIAILATIGLTIYTSAQKQARDAKRKGDIDAIAQALETKKGANSQYQTLSSTDFTNGIPLDSTTAKYCINSDASNPPSPSGLSWSTSSECLGTSGWDDFTGARALPRENWTVCARLEASTGSDEASGLKVYCRSSQR